MMEIGHKDFVKICSVGEPRNWHGMAVKEDGVWVQLPPDDVLLFPGERAVLSAHPKKDLTVPTLKFPCTHGQLRVFLEWVEVGLADKYLGTEVSKVDNEKQNSGRPKGPLSEAVEFAYKKFWDEGNTEILRPSKVMEFLDRLRELADDENKNVSDFIKERIEIVKKRNGAVTITTPRRITKDGKYRERIDKRATHSTNEVSKLLRVSEILCK
jgi:hypothetical protein